MKRIQLAARLKHRGFDRVVKTEALKHWRRSDGYEVFAYPTSVRIFKDGLLTEMFVATADGVDGLRTFLDAMPTTYAQNKAKQKMIRQAYDPATKPAQRCRNPREPMDGQTTLTDEDDTVTIPITAEEVSKIIREELELAEARILKRMRGDNVPPKL